MLSQRLKSLERGDGYFDSLVSDIWVDAGDDMRADQYHDLAGAELGDTTLLAGQEPCGRFSCYWRTRDNSSSSAEPSNPKGLQALCVLWGGWRQEGLWQAVLC